MADLNYKFTGVNSEQLANEVQHLRENSSTFRALESAAAAAGYKTIEIRMGAGVLRHNIADSIQTDPSTRTIRINSDVTGSWGVGGRQVTVGEIIAHELAHAVVPQEFSERQRYDFTERGVEGMWVRRQAGQVARDLGLPGENNADHPITRIPVNEIQGCTRQRPQGDGARDGILFLDGSRGYHGMGASVSTDPGTQDPANSRRLAIDQIEQDGVPTDPDAASGMRYLGRRIAGNPDTSVFATGAPGCRLFRPMKSVLPAARAPLPIASETGIQLRDPSLPMVASLCFRPTPIDHSGSSAASRCPSTAYQHRSGVCRMDQRRVTKTATIGSRACFDRLAAADLSRDMSTTC